MLKFFFTIFVFLAINLSSVNAQGFNNPSFQKNNNYSGYSDNYQSNKSNNDYEDNFNSKDSIITKKNYDNYRDNSENYQYDNRESVPNKYINPLSNNYNETAEFNKPNNNYANSFNSAIPATATKKNVNFKDGKGSGYRVYDNSNRQSYFCNLTQTRKNTFSHDNNFNGVYFGLGVAKIDASVDFSQNSRESTVISPTTIPPYKFNFSGSKTLPSIIIGQGRLFSSGLFLGQEFAMNIGEFNTSSNKIDNKEYKKITYSFSNYSYYSGKLGFNIFKIFLPYVKLALSTSSSRFILQKNDDSKVISGGSFPSVGVGLGVDISIQDHVRAIIDYTQFSGSASGFLNSSNSTTQKVIVNSTSYDSAYSFTRASLIYRF
jgi:hypothetical protein